MKKNNTVNILFCGRGGQGVLKASEVVAWAALLSGYRVKKTEVHGMSQRGGSVESHLRFGKEVLSPLIPLGSADYLVSFDRGEHAAKKNFLRYKGADLVKYLEEAGRQVLDKRQVNVFLLGRLARYLKIDKKNWIAALERVFSARYLEENKRAFYLGTGE
jgi:indolepyruvate ferredoxin oxidoreductase beta subunit